MQFYNILYRTNEIAQIFPLEEVQKRFPTMFQHAVACRALNKKVLICALGVLVGMGAIAAFAQFHAKSEEGSSWIFKFKDKYPNGFKVVYNVLGAGAFLTPCYLFFKMMQARSALHVERQAIMKFVISQLA